MRFSNIKQFPRIYYSVNQSWTTLDEWLDRQKHDGDNLSRLNLNPDFQRGHVWTRQQQIEYVEFMLSGGTSGRDIYFNHPGWMSHFKGEFVLVDGLQRITAAQAFMHNEIPAFGSLYQDYEDEIAYCVPRPTVTDSTKYMTNTSRHNYNPVTSIPDMIFTAKLAR